MTPDVLKGLIQANRRLLQTLDSRVTLLHELLEEDVRDNVERQPFMYGALGSDNAAGILLSPTTDVTFQGRVVIDPDAPFVWTHILATQRFTSPSVTVGDQSFMSIWQGAGGAVAKDPPNVDLGFVEQGSGRILYQSERAGAEQEQHFISGSLFDAAELHSAGYGGFSTGIIREWAGGNGPGCAFELPCAVELPPGDVVQVTAKPTSVDSRVPRVYVTLLGYKVLA